MLPSVVTGGNKPGVIPEAAAESSGWPGNTRVTIRRSAPGEPSPGAARAGSHSSTPRCSGELSAMQRSVEIRAQSLGEPKAQAVARMQITRHIPLLGQAVPQGIHGMAARTQVFSQTNGAGQRWRER